MLMLAVIIHTVSEPVVLSCLMELLERSSPYGTALRYAKQLSPDSSIQTSAIGKNFIAGDFCAFIQGDNIFCSNGLSRYLRCIADNAKAKVGMAVFCYYTDEPKHPRPNYAVTAPTSMAIESARWRSG